MSSQRTGASRGLVGSVHAVDGRAVVRMEDSFDTDIDDLWSAITDPERLARWIGKVEGDLRLGGEFRASLISSREGPARIDVCEPTQRLAGRPQGQWRARWAELKPAYLDQQRALE
jgi:uncharacterized protein YndB with AHSA1/START domain